jgi:hypothetical protein
MSVFSRIVIPYPNVNDHGIVKEHIAIFVRLEPFPCHSFFFAPR